MCFNHKTPLPPCKGWTTGRRAALVFAEFVLSQAVGAEFIGEHTGKVWVTSDLVLQVEIHLLAVDLFQKHQESDSVVIVSLAGLSAEKQ